MPVKKLTPSDVATIRAHLSRGALSRRQLAEMFGVSKGHITHIKNNRCHKGSHLPKPNTRRRLTPSQVLQFREMARQGIRIINISAACGLGSTSTVKMLTGEFYADVPNPVPRDQIRDTMEYRWRMYRERKVG